MKLNKLSVGAVLVLALTLAAWAQPHQSFSFLNCTSIHVTNTIGVTNLSTEAVGCGTNVSGLAYTNLQGTKVVFGATTNQTSLLGDVTLWTDRQGSPPAIYYDTNGVPIYSTIPSKACLSIVVGPSAAAAVATLRFKPLADGTHPSTKSADWWDVAIIPSTTTDVCTITNVPTWKWGGVGKVRLDSIWTTAGAGNSNVIKSVTLNGFVP